MKKDVRSQYNLELNELKRFNKENSYEMSKHWNRLANERAHFVDTVLLYISLFIFIIASLQLNGVSVFFIIVSWVCLLIDVYSDKEFFSEWATSAVERSKIYSESLSYKDDEAYKELGAMNEKYYKVKSPPVISNEKYQKATLVSLGLAVIMLYIGMYFI